LIAAARTASATSDELNSVDGDELKFFAASAIDPPRGKLITLAIDIVILELLHCFSPGFRKDFRVCRFWLVNLELIADPLAIPKAETGAPVMMIRKNLISLGMFKIFLSNL
jgi:hypothetical protein